MGEIINMALSAVEAEAVIRALSRYAFEAQTDCDCTKYKQSKLEEENANLLKLNRELAEQVAELTQKYMEVKHD